MELNEHRDQYLSMPDLNATLHVCGSIIFGGLTIRELLSVRGCTRALRRAYDPDRSRRIWALVRPVYDNFNAAASLSALRLVHRAYEFDAAAAKAWSLLNYACSRGDLAAAQWVVRQFGFGAADAVDFKYNALWLACVDGHMVVARWLAETFDVTRTQIREHDHHILVGACENGHADIVAWLVRHFDLWPVDIDKSTALWSACRYGHLPVIECLVGVFQLPFHRSLRDGSFVTACTHDHLDVVQWFVHHFDVRTEYVRAELGAALLVIRQHSRVITVFQWLVEHFGLTYDDIGGDISAASYGQAVTQPIIESWIYYHFKLSASRPAGAGPPAERGCGT